MMKMSIHPKDIIIISVYPSNNRGSKYMKQKLTELKKNWQFCNYRDSNTQLLIIDGITGQKMNNGREDLNWGEYTFF